MKLITEINEDVQTLVEEHDGKKHMFVEGIFIQTNVQNKNNRYYDKRIVAPVIESYIENYVKKDRAVGQLGHPSTPGMDLDKISHKIISLKEHGNNYEGKAQIIDTPSGNIARTLIEANVKLGTSTRGAGSLRESQGIKYVQNDFVLFSAGDLVFDPSAPDAFLTAVMESKEWIFESGIWKEAQIESTQKQIKKLSSKQLVETQAKLFEQFLKSIK